jgi:transitional endoplasmic reticulum ATPase
MTVQIDPSKASDPQPNLGPRLRVVEARLDDVEQGVVRIGAATLNMLGIEPGEVVAFEGTRKSVARVWMLHPEDDHPANIQMDGITRENAGITLDDRIRIEPCSVQPLSTLLLCPAERATFGPNEVRRIRESLVGRALMPGDKANIPLFSRKGTQFQVLAFEPEAAAGVAFAHTDVRIQENARPASRRPFTIKYEDIGGLDEELSRIREMIEIPMKYPELLAHLRIDPPKGVLLYGPPGTGKTTIVRAVASECKAHMIQINGPEIIHKFYGESEAKLREIFEEAQRKAPSIIFIDEIDAIAPKRSDVSGDVEKRVVAQLLALMDGMVSRGEVVVIGATNLPELLDTALRRPGRFDREVVVKVPNRHGRLQILRIHARGMPLAEDVDLEKLAEVTHGFVGADLEVLCKEAGMRALKDVLMRDDFAEREMRELADDARITMRHFLDALKGIEPTATREFYAEKPNVWWADVGGMHEVKSLLRSSIELPRRYPKLFQAAGSAPPSGIILSGGPGTGKTLLVHALATESGLSFISVNAAGLFSKWVGEAEKALRQVFVKAKQASPCIVFFDEMDSMFPRRSAGLDYGGRDRLIGQFLGELGSLDAYTDVVVIGATNRIDLLEPALLNPDRFGMVITLQPPSEQDRQEILRVHTRRLPLAQDVDLARLAAETAEFTGAELASVCHRASLERIRSFIAQHGDAVEGRTEEFQVRMEDLAGALATVRTTRDQGRGNSVAPGAVRE